MTADCWAAPLGTEQVLSAAERAAIVARVQALLRVRDELLRETDDFIARAEQTVTELERAKRALRP
jgi:hypothetical protein